MNDPKCKICTGWRSGQELTILDDAGKLKHETEPGTVIVLDARGNSLFNGKTHYWYGVVQSGRWDGRRRAVACKDMKPLTLTEEEEREVLERLQTSVRKEES